MSSFVRAHARTSPAIREAKFSLEQKYTTFLDLVKEFSTFFWLTYVNERLKNKNPTGRGLVGWGFSESLFRYFRPHLGQPNYLRNGTPVDSVKRL